MSEKTAQQTPSDTLLRSVEYAQDHPWFKEVLVDPQLAREALMLIRSPLELSEDLIEAFVKITDPEHRASVIVALSMAEKIALPPSLGRCARVLGMAGVVGGLFGGAIAFAVMRFFGDPHSWLGLDQATGWGAAIGATVAVLYGLFMLLAGAAERRRLREGVNAVWIKHYGAPLL